MGAKNAKKKEFECASILSVFEKSLNSNSDINDESLIKKNSDEITKEIKEEVILPREDEYSDSSEIIFEKTNEIKIKDFFENYGEDNNIILNKFYPDDSLNCKKSKCFVPKPVILKTPRLTSNPKDNFFYPFRLSMKSYGIVSKWNEKPNKILFYYQKEHLDCKSCNDKVEYLDDDYLLYAETEKTTPNLEDLQDLLGFRKKMINFRDSLNNTLYNEYENILNCEDIIEDIQEEKKKKRHRSKKKSDWNRYIKYQLKKEKNKSLANYKNRKSEPFPEIQKHYSKNDSNVNEENKKEDEDIDENDEGLSILGMIERVSKRKRTKSVVVK